MVVVKGFCVHMCMHFFFLFLFYFIMMNGDKVSGREGVVILDAPFLFNSDWLVWGRGGCLEGGAPFFLFMLLG